MCARGVHARGLVCARGAECVHMDMGLVCARGAECVHMDMGLVCARGAECVSMDMGLVHAGRDVLSRWSQQGT